MRPIMIATLLSSATLMPLAAVAQQQSDEGRQTGQQLSQAGSSGQQSGQRNLSAQQQSSENRTGQQDGQATPSELKNQTVHAQAGGEIGRIQDVVQGRNGAAQFVVEAGDREIVIPASRVSFQNGRFNVSNAKDLQQFPTFDENSSEYEEADPNLRIAIVGYVSNARRSSAQSGDPSRILIQQSPPTVQVDQSAPQITVRQPQPNVTVRQPRPEIIVRQAQPTVTLNIPQPEIIVRMPQPDVNVSMAQPQVQVRQARPEINVARTGQPEVQVERDPARVQVIQAPGRPNVQVMETSQQPSVRYERSEPRVIVNQAEGRPRVRFERAERTDRQSSNASREALESDRVEAGPEREGNGAAANVRDSNIVPENANLRSFRASDLDGMEVYNPRGQKLGDVARIVRKLSDDKQFVVLEHGGFLGLGEKEVLLPIERFESRAGRLYFSGLTQAELDNRPDWDMSNREYREFSGTETVRIGRRE